MEGLSEETVARDRINIRNRCPLLDNKGQYSVFGKKKTVKCVQRIEGDCCILRNSDNTQLLVKKREYCKM
jgi:hypothetical protein